jgi:hypothetical protein
MVDEKHPHATCEEIQEGNCAPGEKGAYGS